MASVRQLKKAIHGISCELFSECLFCRFYLPNVSVEKADNLISDILQTQNEFIKRVSHVGGKDRKIVKAYYSKLRKDFLSNTDRIIKEMQSLSEK